MQKGRKGFSRVEKQREVVDKGSMPFGRTCSERERLCYFKVVPFAIDAKGGEKLCLGGAYSQGEPECCHQ